MKLSTSGKTYVQNYYILEQTRKEVHKYFGEITDELKNRVEEYWKDNSNDYFDLSVYRQKDGGLVELIITKKAGKDKLKIEDLGEVKFTIQYIDPVNQYSTQPSTQYVLQGFTPKKSAKLISEIKRTAIALNYPDPYLPENGELIGYKFDDVVDLIYKASRNRIEQIIDTLEDIERVAGDGF